MKTWNSAIRSIIMRQNEFRRQEPALKLRQALEEYQRRSSRDVTAMRPSKITVRVVFTRHTRVPMYVVKVRDRYLAAYSMDKLVENMVLGHWSKASVCKGTAKRAFA